MPDGYSSPQEAALANWPEAAGARVVQVSVVGERAQLILETDQDRPYPYYVYCIRHDGLWHEVMSGNAPTYRWDDPNEYDW